MQTEVIKLIFEDFLDRFSYFFTDCNQGFINEVIINMLSRRYRKSKSGRTVIMRPEYKLEYMYFTIVGAFGIFHPNLKVKGRAAMETPAVALARSSVFGDYQLLFDLYPRVELAPFTMNKSISKLVRQQLGEDLLVEEYGVMCIVAETFMKLCELYPESAEVLKVKSLKKRLLFMQCLKQQEDEVTV